ncbi:MAG: GNAT family N-acetyltransferase [Bacteroidetes bacterium]|nr:MAG: GNAT family N-acetyltransferase [Bacteroidota bacterium]
MTRDEQSLIKYLNNKEIYKNTLRIPYPYSKEDAEWWINGCKGSYNRLGVITRFAIRKNDELIGGVGFDDYLRGKEEVECGYWLAQPFWNKGIMTKVVYTLCLFGFNELNIQKITANVFSYNKASMKVLQKVGFKFQKSAKNHCKKNGEYIDTELYTLTKDQWKSGF